MRCLLIDDEDLALKDLMQTAGRVLPDAELEGFTDPQAALRSAQEKPADLVLLEIEIRNMNSLELARALKEIRKQTSIVFITGHSQYDPDDFSMLASGYLLKPVEEKEVRRVLEPLSYPIAGSVRKGLWVQTFGNFEVFVDAVPVRFSRSKAKELFAYLIHKRGSGCTIREIAALLFEDRPYTISVQKQVQTVISAMMRALREAGVSECIIRSYNRISVDPAKVDCDYYRFLKWDLSAVNAYTGEYMSNYSWAEFTVGYLNSKLENFVKPEF